MSVEQINVAIRECLAVCLPARSPLAQLAAFLQGLTAKNWSTAEVAVVDAGVRHCLSQMMHRR